MSERPLWAIDAMAAGMGAQREGPLPESVRGISIDSRSIGPSEAFFAIKGDNRDGHDFVNNALQGGAALAVVAADRRDQFPKGAPLLVVPDVLEGLRDLARTARARLQAKVIGVTGSVGKTGTKEALRLALSREGETHASVASYNNHWGVPLSLARCPETAHFAIFEMGMSHAGEIEPLTRLVRPHVAIITTIEPVHLEFFPSMEAIADAKAEIFLGLEPGGAAVINRDNPHYERLRQKAMAAQVGRIISFGQQADADVRVLEFSLHPDCSVVHASVLGVEVTYKLGAPGQHLIWNSLAVLAAVSLSGADLALAALALAEWKPATGRGTRITLGLPGGTAELIDESYNANPASMRAALALLGQAALGPRGRRIAILGDMLELGADGERLHRELAEAVIGNNVDIVLCSGPLMRHLWEALPSERRGGYADTSSELESHVLAVVQPGDTVMVKGSLGSRMGPLVKALERRYPYRVAASKASA
ncbi:MAG: UDP-N-acetylmuramoyl-tripeptide--D-alanyl-D-alanine ligase [Alphaproteobacteria bacterium]|jgi:UDP-N-acetylmuramoyl-tripeptide--D-alanyl-D-alanine ligase|nr:UDP-N-acetylmuramoyl-tripeptide--D-alanyl-D-alanine ligase [Alphaproteobacteria bacterium]